MYLHLGQDVVVRQQDIVGIFDMDNTTISRYTRSYLTKAQRAGQVETITMELPKSFTVCCERRQRGAAHQTVYVSQISPRTLYKRAQGIDNKEESR